MSHQTRQPAHIFFFTLHYNKDEWKCTSCSFSPFLAQQYLAIKMVLQELSWEMYSLQRRQEFYSLTLYCVHCNYHMKIVAGELKTT